MSSHSTPRPRPGVALVGVLYFLVVCALTTAAVFFAQRSAKRDAFDLASGAQLIAAADAAVYSVVGAWDNLTRSRQTVGSTALVKVPPVNGTTVSAFVTRLTMSVFSIVAEARAPSGTARRVGLVVRLPLRHAALAAALVSAVGVSVGPEVRFVVADSFSCGDTATATLIVAPGATPIVDPALPLGQRPTIRVDSAASDSSSYLRIAEAWWDDLARGADIRLAGDAHVTPLPDRSGGRCTTGDANWGDPIDTASSCASRAPVVFASGDLTIDGGRGQGVLLVDGHLSIAGPFTYSGQIVARHGIETLTDNITISGIVYAWRATTNAVASRSTSSDVVLSHTTTLRYSGCDAQHGVASWQQPRHLRERAWAELF
jgi:hypothetical protein